MKGTVNGRSNECGGGVLILSRCDCTYFGVVQEGSPQTIASTGLVEKVKMTLP
jgi:hypothetical protein